MPNTNAVTGTLHLFASKVRTMDGCVDESSGVVPLVEPVDEGQAAGQRHDLEEIDGILGLVACALGHGGRGRAVPSSVPYLARAWGRAVVTCRTERWRFLSEGPCGGSGSTSLSISLSLHFTSLHFTSLHFTSLHFTSLHFIHFAHLEGGIPQGDYLWPTKSRSST
jgi:hypothetical protein